MGHLSLQSQHRIVSYESIYRLVLLTHESRGPVVGAMAGKRRIRYPGSFPTHVLVLCDVVS